MTDLGWRKTLLNILQIKSNNIFHLPFSYYVYNKSNLKNIIDRTYKKLTCIYKWSDTKPLVKGDKLILEFTFIYWWKIIGVVFYKWLLHSLENYSFLVTYKLISFFSSFTSKHKLFNKPSRYPAISSVPFRPKYIFFTL